MHIIPLNIQIIIISAASKFHINLYKVIQFTFLKSAKKLCWLIIFLWWLFHGQAPPESFLNDQNGDYSEIFFINLSVKFGG